MRKIWVIPAVILVILLGAYFFRWSTDATKSTDTGVTKWKTDHWTGVVWKQAYTGTSFRETPVNKDLATAKLDRGNFTLIWGSAFAVTAIWLLFSGWIIPRRRQKKLAKRDEVALHDLSADDLADYAIVGVAKMARGTDYSAWTADMVRELGDEIKPHLELIWKQAESLHTNFVKPLLEDFSTETGKQE